MYEVHNPVPLIVGSSVGGLLLLALITAVLYKVSNVSSLQQGLIPFPLQGEQELMLSLRYTITSTPHVRKPPPPSFLSFVPSVSKMPVHLSPFLCYSPLFLWMSLYRRTEYKLGQG